MKRQPRAYSYIRFSSMEQKKGASLRRQTEKSEKWAKSKGVPLDDTLSLSDLGVSAFKGKNKNHGALADFLTAIETGRVVSGDYLIVESLDRISREGLYLGQQVIGNILASGVTIVTLNPEREFTSKGQNDIGQSFEIAMVLYRAWEESESKSNRVGDAWRRKREKASTEILTIRCPSWLSPNEDKKGFTAIKEKTKVVKYIFNLAESMGAKAIATTLDNEGITPISGRSKKWSESTIKRLLSDRSVLGEYQPHIRTNDGRKPTGKPVEGYYPAVITETQFYKIQKAISDRKITGGQATQKVSNLFTKLAIDKEGTYLRFKESDENQTYLRSDLVSIQYPLLEKSIVIWAKDLDFSMVLPTNKQEAANKIPDLLDTIDGLTSQIDEVTERIKTGKKAGVLLDLLEQLGEAKDKAVSDLETAKVESSNMATDALSTIKDIVDKATDVKTRSRLRRALQRVIKSIQVAGKKSYTGMQFRKIIVTLHNGNRYIFNLKDTVLTWQPDLLPVDDKKAKRIKTPKVNGINVKGNEDLHRSIDLALIYPELERYRTDAALVREILDLDKRLNLTLGEIADIAGTTMTKVSKVLIKHGRRRNDAKPSDSPFVMNWHEAGRGWVKTKTIDGKKKRFFVGCGKLRELYPHLVTSKGTYKEQTWKAANQWWNDRF